MRRQSTRLGWQGIHSPDDQPKPALRPGILQMNNAEFAALLPSLRGHFRHDCHARAARHHAADHVHTLRPCPQPHSAPRPRRVPHEMLVQRAVTGEADKVAGERLGERHPLAPRQGVAGRQSEHQAV
jgi:hypothetical protein